MTYEQLEICVAGVMWCVLFFSVIIAIIWDIIASNKVTEEEKKMGYKPLMAGAPTIELTHERYEELVRAELQAVQYRTYLTDIANENEKCTPEGIRNFIEIIEGVEIEIEAAE